MELQGIYAIKIEPDYNVEFHRDGVRIGRLDFNGPTMTFEGEAEESAKVFMEYLAASFASRLAPPEGWTLVPVNPTDEMLTAGIYAPIPCVNIDSVSGMAKMSLTARYSAMLRAAPLK